MTDPHSTEDPEPPELPSKLLLIAVGVAAFVVLMASLAWMVKAWCT